MMSLKDTKRRINGVKNTQKITRAMKLVSSAKFARASHAFSMSQPYRKGFEAMLSHLLLREELAHPLLEKREEKKTLCIVLTTDRGFCGGLNSNLLKRVTAFLQEKSPIEVDVMLWGRKAKAVEKQHSVHVVEKIEKMLDAPSYGFAAEVVDKIAGLFESGVYDGVFVLYSAFRNAVLQEPCILRLLPFSPTPPVEAKPSKTGLLTEPLSAELVPVLLKKYIAVQLYQVLLESAVSEHAARMSAMDNATNNAEDVIRKLTLDYNRARQAAITKELIEITSGAEAL